MTTATRRCSAISSPPLRFKQFREEHPSFQRLVQLRLQLLSFLNGLLQCRIVALAVFHALFHRLERRFQRGNLRIDLRVFALFIV